ncbi:MAG: M1 family aminopeptidase [Phycisphaerae bacterium]|jgi:hypothetical protein
MKKCNQILCISVFLLLILSTSNAGQFPSEPNEPTVSQPCNGEGKDIYCGHLKSTLAALMAQGSQQARDIYRESNSYTDILNCSLNLDINPTTEIVSGTNALTVKSLINGLATFTLDLRDNMTVDSVTGDVASYTHPGHTIEITLNRPYDINEIFTVTVTYHGIPQNLGFSSFDWTTHNGNAIFATLSEPWFAHTWWPCKDVLDDKFTMDMWVTVPSWMIVTSNGLLQGTDSVAGGKTRYRWHESYPIATYLVSLTGTNYVHWTYNYNHAAGTMPVEMYAYPESESYVRGITADLVTQIQTFSSAYGEYPFINEKYGITQFQWSGGMENQTLTSQGAYASWLNAHELSHQWWGDMITCKTWHDIWLNEGFATYSEAVYEEKRPGGSYSLYFSRMQSRRPGSYGGTVYVYDISDFGAVFDGTTVYNKAAWVLHMLRHVVGDANFFDILATYRSAYEGDSATTEDFRASAESVYGGDLQWFFDEWVYNGGAPYYRFGWEQQQIGSQNWMRLYINQYQQASYGYPNFKMPIDITINSASTTPVWNNAVSQWYLIKTASPVTSVQFDKNTWILRGTTSSVSYVKGPAKIIDTAPLPNQTIHSAVLDHITIQFSEPITYSNSNIAVTGSLTGAQSFSSAFSMSNYMLTLTFPQPLMQGQTYTVTVTDGILTPSSGYAIDGELSSGSPLFPSGDGLPGGNAVFSFYLGYGADLSGDNKVNFDDFALFAAQWQKTNCGACGGADLSGDGNVNFSDLKIFSASWLVEPQ